MITLTVNGESRSVDADADMPLLWVLRDLLSLTGTKYGCGVGQCGACTVHLDGVAVRACQTPVGEIASKRVTTIEGLTKSNPELIAVWTEQQVSQCGYCQPGQLMSAASLLAKKPTPTDADIDAGMNGNLCRCGTYQRIRAAIHKAGGAKR